MYKRKKDVVLSRFLCYLTIKSSKFDDSKHHYKCFYLNSPTTNMFSLERNLQMTKLENCRCFPR